MAKFDVRYVHKISQTCKCGCTQYSHRRPRRQEEGPSYVGTYADGRPMVLYSDVWGEGPCMNARCQPVPVGDYDGTTPCLEFRHQSEEMDIDIAGDGPGDVAEMLRRLIAAKVVTGDTQLRELRREADGRLIIFPDKTIWHSIIMTPIA